MKRIALVALVLSLVLLCSFAYAEEETKEIRVGTSNVYVTVPAGYEKVALTFEDTNETQVAYYAAEGELMDFDLYHWAKATGETLEAAVAEETENEVTAVEFNGIPFVSYNDVEESEDASFNTVTYIMEDGEYFVEFVYWLDGENAQEKVDAIMATVTVKEDENVKTGDNLIRLGTSDLYITTDVPFAKGELTREDTDLAQVAYFFSEETLLDFDVYHWAKAGDETLESTAALEQEEFGVEISDREINGIATKYYNAAAEESVDGSFPTLTYIIDDGDYLAEIVFWLDGETAADEAEAIISTLTK